MYISTDELQAAIGFQNEIMKAHMDPSEEETEEALWEEKLEAIIQSVSDLIDGMIAVRCTPADVSQSAILKRICSQISVHDVWMGFARNQLPESVQKSKEEAMKMLEKIQQGSLTLTLDTPPEDAPAPIESEFESEVRVFSRMML